ncbi:hypothetical protein GCM10008015_25700 [Flavobacterium palustre]|uniref:TonB C-terminal domain-containing protein n=1 Tax=Flavobacterium palustre TaxID=1476463 RepID=A0ABQ1HP04_9FLAO|nr:energy transducer TonB [Flavobacterium palustre]GGA83710.1 hypothetical protein GCM10008015_25700 [Flavobacterium palustre]
MKTDQLTIILLLTVTTLFAQDNKNKVFHLDSLHNFTTEQDYKYTRIVEDYNFKKDAYVVTEYYLSGKISMSAVTKNKNSLKFEGLRTDYYENGNKKQESNYIDNRLNGKQISWYENNIKKSEKEIIWDTKNKTSETNVIAFWNPEGKQTVIDGNGQVEESDEDSFEKGEIKDGKKDGVWIGKNLKEKISYSEIYKNGNLTSGISSDENNNKFPYKKITEKPTPAKGMDDFYIFIGKNLRTPQNENIDGRILTKFIINKNGNITDIEIVKSLREDLDKQAIKIISQYGSWIPGKKRGIPRIETFTLPISLKSATARQTKLFPNDIIKNTNPNW